MNGPQQDFSRLVAYMEEYPYAALAFSGGTASALLVCALYESHGKGAPLLTANTPFFTQEEIYRVHEVLDDFPKMRSERVAMPELLAVREIIGASAKKRCEVCACEISKRLFYAAQGLGAQVLIDGKAAGAHSCTILAGSVRGVQAISPLLELGYTRQDVEAMLRAIGRAYYIRPANDCLACRFAPGVHIDAQKLDFIEEAEKYIRRYTRSRMQVHMEKNCVQVMAEELLQDSQKQDVADRLLLQGKELGISHIIIDDGLKSFWRDADR